jgi:hypothetical protein
MGADWDELQGVLRNHLEKQAQKANATRRWHVDGVSAMGDQLIKPFFNA